MGFGLIGALGGLGQGATKWADTAMKDEADMAREQRIQEYAMDRMGAQADLNEQQAQRDHGRTTATTGLAHTNRLSELGEQAKLNERLAQQGHSRTIGLRDDEERRKTTEATFREGKITDAIKDAYDPIERVMDFDKAAATLAASGMYKEAQVYKGMGKVAAADLPASSKALLGLYTEEMKAHGTLAANAMSGDVRTQAATDMTTARNNALGVLGLGQPGLVAGAAAPKTLAPEKVAVLIGQAQEALATPAGKSPAAKAKVRNRLLEMGVSEADLLKAGL